MSAEKPTTYELTISGDRGVVATLDLDPDDGIAVSNDGNIYLALNGVELGSLWLNYDDDTLTLGRYQEADGDWVPLASVPLDGKDES